MNKHTLLAGGAGYIGSHTWLPLIESGFHPIIFDNFCNSPLLIKDRLKSISKAEPIIIQGDIRDTTKLSQVFKDYNITGVIYFAGLKAVAESVENPLKYYDYNVNGCFCEGSRGLGYWHTKKRVFIQ